MADASISSTSPMPVAIKELIAGEDLTFGVLGTLTKPVASSSYSPTNYKDAGSVTKANIKAAAGNVYSLRFTNGNAATRFFQIHNKATAPAAGETAARYWSVKAGETLLLDSTYFCSSHYCPIGIGWAVSTTATTFTDSATAGDHTVDVNHV